MCVASYQRIKKNSPIFKQRSSEWGQLERVNSFSLFFLFFPFLGKDHQFSCMCHVGWFSFSLSENILQCFNASNCDWCCFIEPPKPRNRKASYETKGFMTNISNLCRDLKRVPEQEILNYETRCLRFPFALFFVYALNRTIIFF